MPLVFLPDRGELFLWGEERSAHGFDGLSSQGKPIVAAIVSPAARGEVDGLALPLLESVAHLAVIAAADIPALPGSIAAWTLASKIALDLVSRERAVPTIVRHRGKLQARWAAALSATEDVARVAALARSMPPSAHAVQAPGGDGEVWAPEALLRAFLDASVDALVRAARGAPELPAPQRARKRKPGDDHETPWEQRWRSALEGGDGTFEAAGFAERGLADDLGRWSRPALGVRDRLRACFRLELPESDHETFTLRFLLQSPDDPSLLVTAAEVWGTRGRTLAKLGRAFREPQESLLEALGRAARLFAPVAESLAEARPEGLALDGATAWAFLSEGAPALAEAGFGVIVPAELTAAGQRRLRLRLRVGSGSKVAGAVEGGAGIGLDELLSFEWEAAIGDTTLSARELQTLARQKSPLVRHRGQWVAVDPRELAEIRGRLAGDAGKMTVRQALVAVLAGETRHHGRNVTVSAAGAFADLLERLRGGAVVAAEAPGAFRGELRPYQARGLAWLSSMGRLGLGACLADDMGLGKTIQLLAFLLHRVEVAPGDERPALLVAPTSVVGNWQREVERFAPSLTVVRHYVERRGRVLALLLFLKQICNHPAQYLGEAGPLPERSGKLARLAEMLEEAVAAGDKALVFTQFREMGDRLVSHLQSRLEVEVAFLHGGTPRKARDEMVRRFQEEPYGPRVFVLSLKAGGTGLNLTAASHVFHFDRWWNPAVEDQATDRAHRIGQKSAVQVHKLVCAGTVEEKVDRLLEQKRDLAAKVVQTSESWITELGNDELRDLFSLAADAAIAGDDEDGEGGVPGAAPRRQRRRAPTAEARA